MPVSAFIVAAPPSKSIEETMIDARKEKMRKVMWAVLPHRTLTSSHMVCALGALRLISIAIIPKRSTWMEAPEAYQNGPDTPYCQATLED